MSNDDKNKVIIDYVLHLRTIQFFLLVTCFSIFVVFVLSQQKYQLRQSANQIEQIMGVLEKWKNREKWLSEHIEQRISADKKMQMKGDFDKLKMVQIPLKLKQIIGFYSEFLVAREWIAPVRSGEEYKMIPDYMNESGGIEVPMILKDFRELFNSLLRNINVKYPVRLYHRVCVEHVERGLCTEFELTSAGIPFWLDSEISFYDLKKPELGLYDPSSTIFSSAEKSQKKDLDNPDGFTKVPGFGIILEIADEPSDFNLVFPIYFNVDPLEVDVYNVFKKEFGVDWKLRNFEDLFPELNEVTKDYMNLEVKKVKKIIEEKISDMGDQQMEIWGVKIPGHEIALWGVLIIFIIQLYFLLHFSSFNVLVKKAGKPPAVPWIGFYLGWFPQTVFLLLSFVFPTSVIFFLMPNFVKYQTSTHGSIWALVGGMVVFILSLSITVLTIKKVFLFWRVIRKGSYR